MKQHNKSSENNIYIYNAKQLVTPLGQSGVAGKDMNRLQVIEDGAILIINGIIEQVGPTSVVAQLADKYPNIQHLDASDHILLPGFVDAHTHFVFGGERSEEYAWRLKGESYMEIHAKGGGIQKTVNATRQSSFEDLMKLGQERLDDAMEQGITTLEGKSGYGLELETELRQLSVMSELDATHPIDVVATYMGAHSVPLEFKGDKEGYIQDLIQTHLPRIAEDQLATFCDVFCEQGVFSVEQSRLLLTAAKQLGFGMKIHADEVVDTGGAGLAAELGAKSADHLLHASKENLLKMEQQGVVATILPVTAFSLGEAYPDVEFMQEANLVIALASDFNPGSCYSHSIPFLIALATRHMGMSIESVITALTLNGAAALGFEKEIGSLEVGKRGDVVLHKCPNYEHLSYHIVYNHVTQVVKSGAIVWDKNDVATNLLHEKQEDSLVKNHFSERTMEDFLAETASQNPVPGGGSIAAQSGATAAALVEMVANLTLNRKKYVDVQDDMQLIVQKVNPIRTRLLELIDEDAESYAAVMLAYSLPKETQQHQDDRNNAILESLKLAAKTPFEVATLSAQVLELAQFVVEKGNTNAVTDGIVAAMLARTATLSALYNVKINLASIKDPNFVAEYEAYVLGLKQTVEEKEALIREKLVL